MLILTNEKQPDKIIMKKIFTSSIILLLFISNFSFASEISKISLSELQEKANLIVLAKVIKVEKDKNQDIVTIKIDSFLKGKVNDRVLVFTLISRGGLKDFDPKLKKNDTGVFFLKKKDGKIEKAYWGSIAVFQKNNFNLTKDNNRIHRDWKYVLKNGMNITMELTIIGVMGPEKKTGEMVESRRFWAFNGGISKKDKPKHGYKTVDLSSTHEQIKHRFVDNKLQLWVEGYPLTKVPSTYGSYIIDLTKKCSDNYTLEYINPDGSSVYLTNYLYNASATLETSN